MKRPQSARRSFKWSFAALALIVLTLLLTLLAQPVPTWHGKSVHHWIARLGTGEAEADRAIIELDASARPALRGAVTARDNALSRARIRHWSKLPKFLQDRLSPPLSADQLRAKAVNGFNLLGRAAKAEAPMLAKMLDDPRLAISAAQAIGWTGTDDPDVIVALAAGLKSTNTGVPAACAYSFIQLRTRHPAAIAALTNALFDPDYNVRTWAALAFERNRCPDTAVISALTNGLRPVYLHSKSYFARALGGIGPPASNAVPALLRHLDRLSPTNKQHVVEIFCVVRGLGMIGPAASPAVPKITELLGENTPLIPWSAALALWRITGRTNEVLPVLMELCRHHQVAYIAPVLEVIAQMGTNAISVLPSVESFRTHASEQVRLAANFAAWRISPGGTPPPIEMLTDALLKPSNSASVSAGMPDDLRIFAARLLLELGSEAHGALPALQTASHEKEINLREAIYDVLEAIEAAQK